MSNEINVEKIIKFIHKNIESFYNIELTDREKQLMHVYYGMLEIALEDEKDEAYTESIEEMDVLEQEWEYIVNSEYDNEEIASWAVLNVDTLFETIRQEREVADMYRGLE
jgi:primosomal protein N'